MNYRTLKDIDINKAKLNTKTCTGWLQYDLSWGKILSAGNTQFSWLLFPDSEKVLITSYLNAGIEKAAL